MWFLVCFVSEIVKNTKQSDLFWMFFSSASRPTQSTSTGGASAAGKTSRKTKSKKYGDLTEEDVMKLFLPDRIDYNLDILVVSNWLFEYDFISDPLPHTQDHLYASLVKFHTLSPYLTLLPPDMHTLTCLPLHMIFLSCIVKWHDALSRHKYLCFQIGINPGLTSAFKGHHYAGPNNHFCKYVCQQYVQPTILWQ